MHIYDILDAQNSLIVVIFLVTSIFVARTSLSAYSQRRLPGALLIGAASILTIATLLIEIVILPKCPDEAVIDYIWVGMNISIMLDTVLYAVGVTRLITHILETKLPNKTLHPTTSQLESPTNYDNFNIN